MEVEQAAAAWHALWARPDAPQAAEAALLGTLRGLPAFPALPPLADAAVAAAAWSLPLGKAPGSDDWTGCLLYTSDAADE